jgi:hypothetical protein
VRFGIGPFNTEDHIQAAVKAVAEIAAMNMGRQKPRMAISKACAPATSPIAQEMPETEVKGNALARPALTPPKESKLLNL